MPEISTADALELLEALKGAIKVMGAIPETRLIWRPWKKLVDKIESKTVNNG